MSDVLVLFIPSLPANAATSVRELGSLSRAISSRPRFRVPSTLVRHDRGFQSNLYRAHSLPAFNSIQPVSKSSSWAGACQPKPQIMPCVLRTYCVLHHEPCQHGRAFSRRLRDLTGRKAFLPESGGDMRLPHILVAETYPLNTPAITYEISLGQRCHW